MYSIHHQLDVHRFNFSDLPVWNRLLGACRAADAFAAQCGLPRNNKRKLCTMLLFRDIHND